MRIRRIVYTKQPINKVFDYLSDFTSTTLWDPATVVTVRTKGEGLVGTEYLNTSTFSGRQTQLTYVVEEYVENQRIRLRGENRTLVAVDTITCTEVGGNTEVTYEAHFTFKGALKVVAPFLKSAFKKLGDEAEAGMKLALDKL